MKKYRVPVSRYLASHTITLAPGLKLYTRLSVLYLVATSQLSSFGPFPSLLFLSLSLSLYCAVLVVTKSYFHTNEPHTHRQASQPVRQLLFGANTTCGIYSRWAFWPREGGGGLLLLLLSYYEKI